LIIIKEREASVYWLTHTQAHYNLYD